MTPALSTCWNSWRHNDGRTMIEEILDLGFDAVEISHGIRASQLEGIIAARERHRFKIASVHNFMPMPVEVPTDSPDCYEFTSHRSKDRERALRLTLATIDWAAELGAPTVVVHTGRIRSMDLTKPLRKMVADGMSMKRPFIERKLSAIKEREKASDFFNQRVLEMLVEAVDHAGRKGVRLGIENREYYEAVPSERDFTGFLASLDSAHAGYWHDFGHAQIKHNLGLVDHRRFLASMADKLIGCHIHDTRWPFRDHCPPFTGDTPFSELVPLLPPGCTKVLEMSPRTEAGDIRKAVALWQKSFP